MPLSKFKYVGGKDRGINPNKQIVMYDIVFPLGKAVEVPDDVARKLRTKSGREGDEFEEVVVGPELTEAEKQREADIKLLEKSKKKDEKLTPEEITELKAVKAREEARITEIQEAAKAGK
jgi:hypothetical protein